MKYQRQQRGWMLAATVVLVLLMIASLVGTPRSAMADDAKDAQQLVDKARMTFDAFIGDKEMGPALQDLVKKAHGILTRGVLALGHECQTRS